MSTFPKDMAMGAAYSKPEWAKANEAPLIGKPDGPMKYIEEFDEEVGTFTQQRKDLYKMKSPIHRTLMHHVPRDLRGIYKPEQVANYDPDEYEYIIDDMGYALCTLPKKNGQPCPNRAMNMSWMCAIHGGGLHPLDKAISDKRAVMEPRKGGRGGLAIDPAIIPKMTRFQKLLHGIIKVEDLDDEELARGQCRDPQGRFAAKPPNMIPKELHDAMVNQLFVRANESFKVALLPAIETLGEIAKGNAYEPQDRIKAASLIIDRVMGKNPDTVIHAQAEEKAPWELAFRAITGGTRAESRIARGLDPDTGKPIIDAEVIEDIDKADLEENNGPHSDDDSELATVVDDDGMDRADSIAEVIDDTSKRVHAAEVVVEGVMGYEENEPASYMDVPRKPARPTPEEVTEEKTSLRDRIKKERGKRYAARARGHETIDVTPFEVATHKNKDGEGYLVSFRSPVAPAGTKRRKDF